MCIFVTNIVPIKTIYKNILIMHVIILYEFTYNINIQYYIKVYMITHFCAILNTIVVMIVCYIHSIQFGYLYLGIAIPKNSVLYNLY